MVPIKSNLEHLRETVAKAARRSGRSESDLTLVAVTKGVEPERILEAIRCGVKDIGENRIQEAERKFSLIPKDVKRHLVGRLQTNKVRKALNLFDLIQSLDSVKLAREIDRISKEKVLPVLVEVNSSGEQTKSGLRPEDTIEFLRKIADFPRIQTRGLMTIGPLTDDQDSIRNCFRATRRLFEQASQLHLGNCRMEYLSMGMSSDYEIAIQEGSNMVRIGTAIFGPRN